MSNHLSYRTIKEYLGQSTSIAPLVIFRIVFGTVMLVSTIRYMWMGWVDTQLVDPIFHFSYYGFDWVAPLPRIGMYMVFALLSLASIGIILGLFYRISAILFFLCFTYVELIDITYYLNHYYFVSIVALLLIFVPANRYFSIDVKRNPKLFLTEVPRWTILIFQLQISIVYIYAGLAKINYDWLINALPLAIWLPAKTGVPIIGQIFQFKFTAHLFSWVGMFFDTFIIFGLIFKRTRWLAYSAVIVFHALTGILFQIGIFPLVMIFAVLIFFSPAFHQKLLEKLKKILFISSSYINPPHEKINVRQMPSWKMLLLGVFFLFQVVFPWRYLAYPGNLFWTEEGYRFSWRVMLMEKAGTATFYVKDGPNGREGAVINHQFLNSHQEKQMSMQPDLILQYAHLLEKHYQSKGMEDPIIRAEVWVTLNARPAQLLIDPQVDLTTKNDSWRHKDWITSFDSL